MGTHLLRSLCNYNVQLIVVDNLSNSTLPDFLRNGQISDGCIQSPTSSFYKADIRDKDGLQRILSKYESIDVCIHLAAKISVMDSIRYPEDTFGVNIIGTKNILDMCTKLDIKNFVFASSSAVYGNASRLPLSETEPARPISPYGESKLKAEQLVTEYARKIPSAISMRFFNIYGYGQSPEYAGVITKFAQRLEDGLPPIIYGDGQQKRDFISVQDVVRAIMLAADRIDNKKDKRQTELHLTSNIVNVGTGIPTTIQDLARTMIHILRLKKASAILSVPLKPKYVSPVEGDIVESYADTKKVEQYLGFRYHDSLYTGLERLYGH